MRDAGVTQNLTPLPSSMSLNLLTHPPQALWLFHDVMMLCCPIHWDPEDILNLKVGPLRCSVSAVSLRYSLGCNRQNGRGGCSGCLCSCETPQPQVGSLGQCEAMWDAWGPVSQTPSFFQKHSQTACFAQGKLLSLRDWRRQLMFSSSGEGSSRKKRQQGGNEVYWVCWPVAFI